MAIQKGMDPVGLFIDEVTGTNAQRDRDLRDQKAAEASATAAYEELRRAIPSTRSDVDFGFTPDADVRGFDVGKKIDPMLMEFRDRGPSEFEGLGSEFQGMESEFSGLGPSSFEGMGPSEFEDLQLDPAARAQLDSASGYFGDLMGGGRDAAAEAAYQRRVALAEQGRKANTDAALRDAEARGMAGQGTLAALTNAQGSATDVYMAGLEADAMEQQRRDAAGRQYGELGATTAGLELDAGTRRAAGVDAYDTNRASALDAYGFNRASGVDQFGVARASGADRFAAERAANVDDFTGEVEDDFYHVQGRNVQAENESRADIENRRRNISDINTRTQNDVNWYNQVTAPQNYFNNLAAVTSGQTGQWNTAADRAREDRGASLAQSERESNERSDAAASVFTFGAGGGFGGGDAAKVGQQPNPNRVNAYDDEEYGYGATARV